MFEIFTEFYISLALTVLAVVGWMSVVQYSRYQSHIKKHKDDEDQTASRKFAFLPYFIIPCLFGAVAVLGGLVIASYFVTHGWTVGMEYETAAAVVSGVVSYCMLDKFVLRQLGNAVYFDVIEDKVAKSAETAIAEKTVNINGKEYDTSELEVLLKVLGRK